MAVTNAFAYFTHQNHPYSTENKFPVTQLVQKRKKEMNLCIFASAVTFTSWKAKMTIITNKGIEEDTDT